MGYMEMVFQRAESKFSSIDKQIEWLGGFGAVARGNAYELAALEAYEDLKKAKDIKDQIPKAGIILIDQLQTQSQDITITKVRRDVRAEIKSRKSELESQFRKVETQTVNEYKQKIKSAESTEELKEIIKQADSPTIPEKTYNKIKSEADKKMKELKREESLEKQAKIEAEQKRIKEEKIRQRQAEKEEKARLESERIEEQRRITKERQREKEAERELQREIEREERRIAERIARENL
jgi:hypothetical protein